MSTPYAVCPGPTHVYLQPMRNLCLEWRILRVPRGRPRTEEPTVSASFFTPLPPEALAPVGCSVITKGAVPVAGLPPALTVPPLWDTALTSSATIPADSSVSMMLDTGLAADPVVVQAVVQLQPYGAFLRVGDWLAVGLQGSVTLGVSLDVVLGATSLLVEPTVDPLLVAGTWAVIRLVVSGDQIVVTIGDRVVARLPLGPQFVVPSPVFTVVLGVEAGQPDLIAAALAIGDDASNLTTALDLADSTGFGDVNAAYLRVGGKRVLGGTASDEEPMADGRFQIFEQGAAYWTAATGGVVVQGPIFERYQQLGAHLGPLGHPLTDVQHGTAPYVSRSQDAPATDLGDASSMARFQRGAIAWSRETDAHEVLDEIATHWLLLGGPSSVVGLPVGPRRETQHGWRHGFQFGDVFHDAATGCFEVHDKILDRYEGAGSWDGVLGSPTTDVCDVLAADGSSLGATVSSFQHGAIYATPFGVILLGQEWNAAYQRAGGPAGALGLPTHEQQSAGPVDYVEFEHGLILNHVSAPFRVVTEIDLKLVGANAPDIDDGWEFDPFPSRDHDAELITHVTVQRDGTALPGWDRRRFPGGDDHGGRSNDFGNEHVIVPVTAGTVVTLVFAAEDWDFASANDGLGGLTRSYAIDTLWGQLGPKGPTYEETGSGGDGDVTYAYSIGLPVGPLSPVFRENRWWQYVNKGTDVVGYPLYSRAFADVEAHHDVWDTMTNPLDHLFYELAVRGIADGGNCFGMSSVGHRALFDTNAFRLPLSQYAMPNERVDDAAFPGWLRDDLNVGQARQLAASVVGTMLARIADLSLFNPVAVAARLAAYIGAGDLPVISFQASGFSSGHALLCYGTQPRPGHPDTILIADPNVPFATSASAQASRLEVDSNGAWRFFDDGVPDAKFRSDLGALFFDIPGSVVRAPTVTPMAALGLGVNAVMSGFAVMGGDADHELVRPMGQGTSIQAVPTHQASPLARMYATTGSVPSGLTTVVIARSSTDVGLYARTANQAVGARISLDGHGTQARLTVERFDGSRPRLIAMIDQRPTLAEVHLASLVGRAQRPGWRVDAVVTVDGNQPLSMGLSTVGVGVQLEGLAPGPAPTIELSHPDGVTSSRYVLDDAVTLKQFELRPADMASPFGAQLLIAGGSQVLVSPSL